MMDSAIGNQPKSVRLIRTTHTFGFRPGVWAVLEGVSVTKGRACYDVRFEDGVTDQWVITDPDGQYEFMDPPTSP